MLQAVARGDLSQKIDVDVKGELLELKVRSPPFGLDSNIILNRSHRSQLTVNNMVDSLSIFAREVTRVSREVGTEGILGGKANVEGVSGEWRNLTDNVNEMASKITAQVRGIATATVSLLRPWES